MPVVAANAEAVSKTLTMMKSCKRQKYDEIHSHDTASTERTFRRVKCHFCACAVMTEEPKPRVIRVNVTSLGFLAYSHNQSGRECFLGLDTCNICSENVRYPYKFIISSLFIHYKQYIVKKIVPLTNCDFGIIA